MSERAVVDTNVLVFALDPKAAQHVACRTLLGRAQGSDAGLCLTSQVLAEFYAVTTDARRSPQPRTPEDALKAIMQFVALPGMALLPSPEDVVGRWVALARRKAVKAGEIFDLQLIATMLANGVTRIYTFNAKHFQPFAELEVFTPATA